MSLPRNPETICHVCAALRVDGCTTDALQDAVAGWLRAYDESGGVPTPFDYLAPAADLLALIARTAKAQPRPAEDPPF